jgi:hypothetical protein
MGTTSCDIQHFFGSFCPTGAAMVFFIALPLVSVVVQSVFAPHLAVLVEVESCTPLLGCTVETKIDQDATAEIREAGATWPLYWSRYILRPWSLGDYRGSASVVGVPKLE